MKISCTKDNLFQGLAATSRVSNKHIHLPILNNVLLKADGNTIRLTSTNLEMAVVCQLRGKVEEDGEFTVPSKLFFDYVNLLPNERIDLEKEGTVLHISCKGNETRMNGMDATEFPLVPPVVGDRVFRLDIDELRLALLQVLFAVATSEARPELAGVSFSFHDPAYGKQTLTLAATDSYRLAERMLTLDAGEGTLPVKTIIPAQTLSELSRILGLFRDAVDAPQTVEIRLSDVQVVFRVGSVELTSRTIEGTYPDYQQIIPGVFKTTAVLNREALVQAVKTASLFSRTGLYDVALHIDPVSGAVRVVSNDAGRGENTAECAGVIEGEPNTITVNFRYLLDGLGAMKSDEIFFGLNDGTNPALLKPTEGSGYLYLIMPIKQ